MPGMYNHIIFGPPLHCFIPSNLILHSIWSKLSISGRMFGNKCKSWALRGILFLRLLRNMDYEWGQDQTCCGFNMYESFHMHQTHSFICHSRWGSGSTFDIGEKQPHGLWFFSPVLPKYITFSLILLLMFITDFFSATPTKAVSSENPYQDCCHISTLYIHNKRNKRQKTSSSLVFHRYTNIVPIVLNQKS